MFVVARSRSSSSFSKPTSVVMGPGFRRDDHVAASGSFMTHPSIHARTQPNKIAYQMAGSGKAITYRELDELSNQGAHLFRKLGLKAGDHIAALIGDRRAFMEICWAAQRSGLYYTAISRYLAQDEIAYIVRDCGARVVITSPKCAEQIKGLVSDAPD